MDDQIRQQAFNDEVVFEALRAAATLSRPAAGLTDGQLAVLITAALGPLRLDEVKASVARLFADGRRSGG